MALSRRERREHRKRLWREKRLGQFDSEEAAKALQASQYKGLLGIYDRHYLKLLLIPTIIFAASLGLFIYQLASTGDFVSKGISLKGGLVLTIPVEGQADISLIGELLSKELPISEIEVRSATELGVQRAVIITTDDPTNEKQILEAISGIIPGALNEYSSETTGSSLGSSFFKETTMAMLFAFFFMGVVVFVAFRSLAPSLMVIFTVLADIIETIVAVNLLGMKVSAAGIAAFLMLIGYSVDTDILLTSRVLRGKEGSVFYRIISAAKTGLMMTLTALLAIVIALIFTQNATIKEIMTILLIGLLFDIANTWLQNTALLRYYVEKMLPRRVERKAAKRERLEEQVLEDAKKMGAIAEPQPESQEPTRQFSKQGLGG
jgi:preprotein translocase subunit SecF